MIENNVSQLDQEMVLVCGPSCIGKSYFLKQHQYQGHKWKHVSSTSRLNTILTDNHLSKKRAIILGVPCSEWRKRIKNRYCGTGEEEKRMKGFEDITKFTKNYKNTYIKWIEKLDYLNIPYIFIDSRNNYPTLDKSSFFTMLTEHD